MVGQILAVTKRLETMFLDIILIHFGRNLGHLCLVKTTTLIQDFNPALKWELNKGSGNINCRILIFTDDYLIIKLQ